LNWTPLQQHTLAEFQQQAVSAKFQAPLIGALVYMSLTSGMNLLGTDISLQYIIRGAVLAAAVIFDAATRGVKK